MNTLVERLINIGCEAKLWSQECNPLQALGKHGASLEEIDKTVRSRNLVPEKQWKQLVTVLRAEQSTPDALGKTVLGRYQILSTLGSGGFGDVYRALDLELKRFVAIKRSRRSDRARFLREAQATARLDHPHIVPIYDVGEEDGFCYLVLQYVEGTTLVSWIETHPDLREIVRVMAEAANATAFAHRNNVLHRDLKPENILIDTTGKAYVTDFGLAREMDAETRLTRSGDLLGTPAFMASEQTRGDPKGVDVRTDVYGLGATLYFALTRQCLFQASSLQALLWKICNEEPVPIRRFASRVPQDLATACHKALVKEKHRRYPSADAFAEDLRRFLHGEAILARPPSVAYRFVRWARRRRILLLFGATAALLLGTGWMVFSVLSRARNFREAKNRAEEAFRTEDWGRALIESERALQIRDDATAARIASECRTRLSERRARQQLLDRLAPMEQVIREARHFFYIRGEDIELHLRQIEEVLGRIEEMLRDPAYAAYPDGWRALGMGWYFIGDGVKAEEALLQAGRLRSEDGWVRYYLGRIYIDRLFLEMMTDRENLTPTQQARARRFGELAQEYLGGPNARWDALPELDQLLAETYLALAEQKSGRVLGLCDYGISRFGSAMGTEDFRLILSGVDHDRLTDHLNQALDIRPHYAWAYFVLAATRPPSEASKAIDYCTRTIRLQRRCAHAYYNRAILKWTVGDIAGSEADAAEAIRLQSDLAMVHSHLAGCYVHRGKIAEAVEAATKAIDLDPDMQSAFVNRGIAYQQQGEPGKAIADFDQALRISPEDAGAYVNRAEVWIAFGQYQKAIQDCDQAIRFEPNHAVAYFNRAGARGALGDFEEAIRDYGEALRILPNYAAALANRGSIRLKQEDWDLGLADLEAALQIDPRCADAYANRAMVRLLREDRAGAMEDFRKALQFAPPNWPHRAEVERRLKEL